MTLDELEIQDSRTVVLALLNTIMGNVSDREAVTACKRLVEKLQDRWNWRHPLDPRIDRKV